MYYCEQCEQEFEDEIALLTHAKIINMEEFREGRHGCYVIVHEERKQNMHSCKETLKIQFSYETGFKIHVCTVCGCQWLESPMILLHDEQNFPLGGQQ